MLDGVLVDEALAGRPLHAPLDAAEVVAMTCLAIAQSVRPLLGVVRRQLIGVERRVGLDESLGPVVVPLVGCCGAIALGPLQEEIAEDGYGSTA